MEHGIKRPEILAPAGSIQTLKAVIAAGCDAVYMGGSRFGARAYADNPAEKELIEAIGYCHLHGVKLYMTVNTLLKEEELSALYDFFLPYYKAGVDGVLVQDLGVLRALKEWFPSVTLHASTQMTITQGKMAEFYRDYGITRIVPARELSLSELKEMRKETEAEIEVFVHGALCYCFSGQCLFSSMQGGRSGNRGRCAQPCRQRYRLGKNGREGYFLSPKELCNLSHIGELIEIGVDSFKIEGRMKRAEYAAFVTSIYRKYVDLYISEGKEGYERYLSSHQEEWEADIRKLSEFYNREGFTAGYLEGKMGEVKKRHSGKRGDMLSVQRPRHGGVPVGRVLSAGKNEVEYEVLLDLSAQDVVEFRSKEMETLYEYTLGKSAKKGERIRARYKQGMAFSGDSGKKFINRRISAGDLVYRTKNQSLLLETEERYINKKIQIGISGRLYAAAGERMELRVHLGEYQAVVYGEVCETAKSQPATKEFVEKIFGKTGESRFYFEQLEVLIAQPIFLSVGMLKTLRREAFAALEEAILNTARRNSESFLEQADRNMESRNKACGKTAEFFLTASVMTFDQLEAVLLKKEIGRIYLHTELMDFSEIYKAAERIRKYGKSPWLAMPAVFRSDVEELFWKELSGELPVDGFLVKNGESLLFLKEWKKKNPEKEFEICSDAGGYVMNEKAFAFYRPHVSFMTLPYELTWEEIAQTSYFEECEFIGYGRIPLMVSAQCMQANTERCVYGDGERQGRQIVFSDEKKRKFIAVNYCKYCYNIIYQEKPVYIREVLEDRKRYPVKFFRFAFTTETEEEVQKILEGEPPFTTYMGHFYKGIE